MQPVVDTANAGRIEAFRRAAHDVGLVIGAHQPEVVFATITATERGNEGASDKNLRKGRRIAIRSSYARRAAV